MSSPKCSTLSVLNNRKPEVTGKVSTWLYPKKGSSFSQSSWSRQPRAKRVWAFSCCAVDTSTLCSQEQWSRTLTEWNPSLAYHHVIDVSKLPLTLPGTDFLTPDPWSCQVHSLSGMDLSWEMEKYKLLGHQFFVYYKCPSTGWLRARMNLYVQWCGVAVLRWLSHRQLFIGAKGALIPFWSPREIVAGWKGKVT